MSNIERSLELTFRFCEELVEIDVYEPESGECNQFEVLLSFDEHPEFDKRLGDEIYSWLALWKDESKDEKE